jgi:hypothetical protein
MSWRCFFHRRKILRYLDGEVSPRKAMYMERHLFDCLECKELFTRLRDGHQAGRQFGRIGPEINHNPPDFEELWSDVNTKLDGQGRPGRNVDGVFQGMPITPAFRVFITSVLAGLIILLVFNGKALWRAEEQDALPTMDLKYSHFTPVRIPEFASKIQSHIVTEGFVRAICFDEQEKTLHIKLVEFLHKSESEPFVICEILSPSKMAIPQEGNRIRVYGMARYDAQPGRGWHEVNPVLNMAVLKH